VFLQRGAVFGDALGPARAGNDRGHGRIRQRELQAGSLHAGAV